MRDVPVLKEDKDFIGDAVRKGEVTQDVMKRAQRRARNPQEKHCPFLGEQGECAIYPYRPVVCINHGNGGLPRNQSKRREILGGSAEDIEVRNLGPYSCENCIPHVDQDAVLPSEVVRKGMFIRYELERRPRTSLNTFVAKELPHY